MSTEQKIKLLSGKSISYNTKHGAEIYRRSLIVLLQAAINKIYPDMKTQVGQTLMHGYYFEVVNREKLPPDFVRQVSDQMKSEVEQNKKFRRETFSREKAIELFSREGRIDKVRALSCLENDKIELVFLNGYYDYMLTECIENTGTLKTFNLIGYNHGFILQFPVRGNIGELPSSPSRQENLYKVYMEKKQWDEILGVRHVADLVQLIESGETGRLIKIQEAFHEKKIETIAGQIKELYPARRIIFIAGPSAAGKTTFIKRLAIAMRVEGLVPHEISLDDYFLPRNKTPRTSDGDYDFESVKALDLDLFKDNITRLLEGEKVNIPEFDFKTGHRKNKDRHMILEENSVILIEGIHGLNPILTAGIEKKESFGIFVSSLTQLCIDSDTRIFTSDSRLMRRIIRDNLFRGYSAYDTIKRFPKVRLGEDRYIFPYQARADLFFNSSLIYEQAVLKPHLVKLLKGIKKEDNGFYEARRLLSYLGYFRTIPAEPVPDNSILREFIGKSFFNY
ncbi:MAG: nucleoside kinase [Elusimicrobiota bacterium]|nr:nucleoside kinase [Elusimicrobiota bacterium]